MRRRKRRAMMEQEKDGVIVADLLELGFRAFLEKVANTRYVDGGVLALPEDVRQTAAAYEHALRVFGQVPED